MAVRTFNSEFGRVLCKDLQGRSPWSRVSSGVGQYARE
jgi:hypothetical protein